MELLRQLTEINGVSGNEEKVRKLIIDSVSEYADAIEVDSMGNLYVFKSGSESELTIMLSAHMDEVGLMVTGFGDKGMLRFNTVGGIDARILLNKRVAVGDNEIPGIIGCKPVHLQEKSDRGENIDLKNMYIDIGADTKNQAEDLVSPGDYIAFKSSMEIFGDQCIKAKALDDRIGCRILVEMLKNRYCFNLVCCFTVQEEVGLRGASVIGNRVKPDIAVVVEGTTCSDVPDVEPHLVSTRMGAGPALTIMDRTAVCDKNLLKQVSALADKNNIPYQYKQTATGGNDAGRIQTSGKGIRVISISVPCRYIHSPVSVMSFKDYENCKKLINAVLEYYNKEDGTNV